MEIKITDLQKSYGGMPVFWDLSLTLSDRRPTCIMGASGIGKTTLFSIILGLARGDGGSVEGARGQKFSAVFQEDRLCEDLSAVMNVAIACPGVSAQDIEQAFRRLNLAKEELRKPVSRLSGGQRRRVAIARAMLADSRRILMDEPFKGLDSDTGLLAAQFILANLKGRLLAVISHHRQDSVLLDADVVYFEDICKTSRG